MQSRTKLEERICALDWSLSVRMVAVESLLDLEERTEECASGWLCRYRPTGEVSFNMSDVLCSGRL